MSETEKIAGVSSKTVQAKTGKTWDEWFAILDAEGAQQMAHPQIARHLSEQHGVPDWWCQMVTVGYEQARGMREVHQKVDGFVASASKTVAVPVDRLFAAWADDAEREKWLPDTPLVIRKATPGKSLRVTWADGTDVDVNLWVKGDAKSQVSVQHARLQDADAGTAMKVYWQQALSRLAAYLRA